MLLILPSATYRAHDFIAAAAALGAEVIVASDRRQAMSALMGDRALALPLEDPEEAAERGRRPRRRAPLDAVVAVDDQGVQTAALAAERARPPDNRPGRGRAHARQGRDARAPSRRRACRQPALRGSSTASRTASARLPVRAQAAVAGGEPRRDPRRRPGAAAGRRRAHPARSPATDGPLLVE